MANGRVTGDEMGELTCYTANGQSLVDYTFLSSALFQYVTCFEIGMEDQFTHMPQIFKFKHTRGSSTKSNSRDYHKQRLRYKWPEGSAIKLSNQQSQEYMSQFHQELDEEDVENATNTLTALIRSTGKKTTGSKKNVKSKENPWWDDDLETMRKVKFDCLKLFRLEHTSQALAQYKQARTEFKRLYRVKVNIYRQGLKEKFSDSKSMNDMWKFVKSFKESKSCVNSITTEEWNTYFENLLNTKNHLEELHEHNVDQYLHWHEENCELCKQGADNILDNYFSAEEIMKSVSNLSNNKAPGLDGVVNEIIKEGRAGLVPLITRPFNTILCTGKYPKEWCKAIIVPIHKGGDVNDTNNYRGISLISHLGKLFCSLINQRLIKWANQNNHMYEQQAGFTKGKSTIDQVFILQSVINKYLQKKKGRCYAIYVDFAKAFDRVPHSHLFYLLCEKGAHGRILHVLQNMYSKLQSCVSDENTLSDLFKCTVGTRQGCMISPFLFIFYLNELVRTCTDLPGIYIDENHTNLNMLLYADDLVIIGDHVGRIQHLLNSLNAYCKKWGLSVNLSKTKAMVYRNGGIIKKTETFYFDDKQLESVSYYKYLGILMSTRLSWSPAQRYLASQAERACYALNDVLYNCDFSFKIGMKLFDACVLPILTYGGELFAQNVHNCLETVKLKYFKKLLGVGRNSNDAAVRGECGQYKVYVTCVLKTIKYWFKLLSQEEGTLLNSCYNMLFTSCENGKVNWASSVKQILSRYGFFDVWVNQGTQNVRQFLYNFEVRIKDCERQNWKADITRAPKLYYYCMFKTKYETELYLFTNLPRKVKKQYAKFRLSNHNLEVERGRHTGLQREDRLCSFCGIKTNLNAVECEFHMLLECTLYQDLRSDSPNVLFDRTLFNFVKIMSCKDNENINNVAWFIWKCFSKRKSTLDK